ncbi:MAG TPA: MBL fold metallo-hydrolase [Acidimicrobiia bacterium]|nr:MBL fold metallo-hydrolase [Acidimicrobiia bacterium]
MKLAESLYRIGTDLVNVYLIEDDGAITVIDTGIPGQWKDLLAELDSMGRSLEDIQGVILTHADSDHLGFAERIRRQIGVPVYVHEADAAQARGEVKKKNPAWGRVRLGPTLSFLWYAARRGGLSMTPVEEVVTVHGGETLDLPGAPRIVHTPGHSPGSVAVHSSAVDALFVGDAMTTRHVLTGETGPRPAPFTLDPGTALSSLHKWAELEARWVLPGHGYPWDQGVSEAVARVIEMAKGATGD